MFTDSSVLLASKMHVLITMGLLNAGIQSAVALPPKTPPTQVTAVMQRLAMRDCLHVHI